ncbi:Beta-1 4-N-acetylgalactosaminyltransferase bre-4 [Fasciola hepatica]|uniref:Beta-1 4-N-acetylgalactosaminyltransferase bre-4 n=1 Tax=Fasciola hepatica TaxID=6192 RepID=A0A2H1BU18_FASHE|nr:Beta-1 4-N-acetylgalactosaminyltransferase bre-4 [Fasciola hepatica]
MLMNAAFVEALRLFPFHCITLHDVDLLALSDDTPYGCPTFPQHTSVHIDKFRNRSQILTLGEARYRLDGLNSLNYTLVDQYVKFYHSSDENATNMKGRSNQSTVQHWLVHLKIDVGRAPSWLRIASVQVKR